MWEDRTLALLELSEDLLFHKIPQNQIEYYIDNSLKIGEEWAVPLIGQDILSIYKSNNIKIEYHQSSGEKFGVVLRGQAIMDKSGCKVVVYKDSITSLAQNSKYQNFSEISYDEALEIHLAHELFHFLEYKNDAFVSNQLEKIESLKLFSFSRKSTILRTSEIAAHTFAKKLLNLSFLPNLYDYIYLINNNKWTQESLEIKIKELENKYLNKSI